MYEAGWHVQMADNALGEECPVQSKTNRTHISRATESGWRAKNDTTSAVATKKERLEHKQPLEKKITLNNLTFLPVHQKQDPH